MNTTSAPRIDFSNTKEAYQFKSTAELKHAEMLFGLLNNKLIGGIGKAFLKFAINVGLPVKGVIKATLYKHFVGGESLEDCLPMMETMASQHVKSILDYSEEGKHNEADFEKAFQELKRNIEFAGRHKDSVPLTVFKTTAIAATDLLEKVSANAVLSDAEKQAWNKVEQRFELLCQAAYDNKVPLMVDAEETWIQKAIDDLTERMMQRHNIEDVYVINTFQMYLKGKLDYLQHSFTQAREQGYKLGVKIVRGAYMEKERARAIAKGYASPVQDTKEDSDRDYNAGVQLCLNHLDEIMIIIGTHNEDSARMAAELVNDTPFPINHPHLWFSQLLGMCDHISFTLGNMGYNVAKYVPYGAVKTVTPYLIRRADENSSVAGQAVKEMALLKQEIRRRRGDGNK